MADDLEIDDQDRNETDDQAFVAEGEGELKLPFDNIGQRTNADHFRTFSWRSFDQFTKKSKRFYYSDLKLERLHKLPNIFVKLFFYLFPFLKYEVHLKFKIVK